MLKDLLRNGMVIFILILFVGASVTSGVNEDSEVVEKQSHNDLTNKRGCGTPLGVPPDEEWNKTFEGPDSWSAEVGRSVEQTPDGGYLIMGGTTGYGMRGWDVWLIKTDANGNEQWSKTYGGVYDDWGYSRYQTIDGGSVIVGSTSSYGPSENYSAWVIKTDSHGNEHWNKTYGGPHEAFGHAGHQTTDGGYIIVGSTDVLGLWEHDAWLIKTDYCGNEQWNRTFGGAGNQYGFSVKQTTDGGYILSGLSDDLQGVEVWLIKTDSSGNEQWNKTFEGGFESRSVEQTNDGGYILTVSADSDVTHSVDIVLIKTDANGTEQWNKTYGGLDHDFGNSLGFTADGGYIITGETRSYGAGEGDVWLIKTDSHGNEQWNKTFGEQYHDVGYSGQQTADGGYIVTGHLGGYEELHPTEDLWLIKIASENEQPVANFAYTPEHPTKYDTVSFTDTSVDSDGTIVTWWWDFGDHYYSSVQHPVHRYHVDGMYTVNLTVTDNNDSTDMVQKTIEISTENNPPTAPLISGPTQGKAGEDYDYSFVSFDPEGDDVYYWVEWYEGCPGIQWNGPYPSGEVVILNFTYPEEGDFTIRAKAKDVYDAESDWGILEVTMPKSNVYGDSPLTRLILHLMNRIQLLR